MSVTALDAAADLEDAAAQSVLRDLVVDQVTFTAAAIVGCLDGGEGCDPDLMAALTAPRSYADLWAMVLLLADCADKAQVTEACGINPGLAAANARRMAEARHQVAEYAWLRDGGVIKSEAAGRTGVRSPSKASERETAYQRGKRQQREEAEASAA